MTYAQLWRASPDAWNAAAAAARLLAGRIADRAAGVSVNARATGQAWDGTAAQAASRRLTSLREALGGYALPLIAADQALTEHGLRIGQAKAALAATVTAIDGTPITIDRDGQVGSAPGTDTLAAARRTADGIQLALSLATAADADTANILSGLVPDRALPVAEPPAWAPYPGSDPMTAARWWAGLDEGQRRWLVLHRPELVGGLDGIPVAVRDQANRLLLAASDRPDLQALRDRLGRPGSPRAYLMRFDERTGRVVVALGDPDTADHVLVHVPGTGSTVGGIGADLHRAGQVVARAGELAPEARTAAMVWLGYDAPDGIPEAMCATNAHDAGADLHRFVDGVRTSHTGAASPHVTVLGHSYGSLVVGTTARDHGLAADEVVFVGSPGVGVGHAGELRLPAGHVWSSTALQDPIQYVAPSLGQVARDAALTMVRPSHLGIAAVTPDEELWHGHNPTWRDFGGRVFVSASGPPITAAHNAYWDSGNVALDNIARITLGPTCQAGVR